MKAPKNFYNTVDQNKLGIDDLFTRMAKNENDITTIMTNLLPDVSSEDNGNILEVIEGVWDKSNSLNSIIDQLDLIKLYLGMDSSYELTNEYDFTASANDLVGDVNFTLTSGAVITDSGLYLPSSDAYGLTSNASANLYPTRNSRYVITFGDIDPTLENAWYFPSLISFGNSFKFGYNPQARKWYVNDAIEAGEFSDDFLKKQILFITFGDNSIRIETIDRLIYEGTCTTDVNQALMFGSGRIGFIKATIKYLKVYAKGV